MVGCFASSARKACPIDSAPNFLIDNDVAAGLVSDRLVGRLADTNPPVRKMYPARSSFHQCSYPYLCCSGSTKLRLESAKRNRFDAQCSCILHRMDLTL